MKHRTVSFIIILLLLAACATLEPGAPDLEQTEPPEVTATARPPAGLGIVKLDEKEGKLRGGPVDPATLADRPGYDAVDFGHHYAYALSPDGRTMALIAWPAGSHNQGGVLQLVDLLSWEVAETGVTVDGYAPVLQFSADGRAVYWAKADLRDTAHAVPRDYRLYRHEVEGAKSAEAATVVALPDAFMPWEMRPLPAGERLAIYGVPTDANNVAQGPPRVLLIDLALGEVAADVELKGVAAGQVRVETEAEGDYPYRMVNPAPAWDVARSLLYVIHGDEDRVTVVDLEVGAVARQAEVRPQASLLERIVGWGARTAAAKIVPGADKEAALSPDGRRLYVTGLRREMWPDWEAYDWPYDEIPLGIQVIDTATLAEVGRLDVPVTNLALSPDGRRLLATGAYSVPNTEGGSERVAHGLYLVDAASLNVAAHLLPEEEVTLQAFSPDGRRAYVSTADSEWLDGQGYRNWRATLHVVKLDVGVLAAERAFPGSFLDVVPDRTTS